MALRGHQSREVNMVKGSITYQQIFDDGLVLIKKSELELLFEDVNRLGYENAEMHNALEMLSTTYALWEKSEPYEIKDYIQCINRMNQDAADVHNEIRQFKHRRNKGS